MYFFLVEITYLYFFGDVFLSRCTLQMKSHLVKMLNKVSLLLLLLLLLLLFISLVQHIFMADGSLVNIFRKNFFDLTAASLEIETERDFYSLQELFPFIYSVKAVNVTWKLLTSWIREKEAASIFSKSV